MELVVARIEPVVDEVIEIVLAATDGGPLPQWNPGAHLELVTPVGAVRQYSLCGPRDAVCEWRIAVLREPEGRGGSESLHTRLEPHQRVTVRGPRNNFRMLPAAGYRFVASGIGITPILPMIEHCEETGVPWSLDYIVRERGRAAYLDRLPERGVTLHITSEHGRPDLDAIAFGDGTGRRLYACGSTSLLVGLEEAARRVDAGPLHAEWFAPRPVVAAADARDEFEVAFNRSGVSAVVQAADSIVDAASRVGVDIPVSCSQGVCGSCETSLLGGIVDHRDSVLTDTERSEGLVMMPCVSRARSDTLVLDA